MAKRFGDIFNLWKATEFANSLYPSQVHLQRLQGRLNIGSSLPSVNPDAILGKKHLDARCIIRRDPPGGRHNNDHDDICQIRVMPSYDEIVSTCTEHLPVHDPTQWHIGGLNGLLDRNFRLLREDTVGQLRDAIHQEVNRSRQPRAHNSQLRTHIYRKTRIVRLFLSGLSGFQFQVEFPQIASVAQLSK